jgi:hypothetical protein
MSLRIVAEMESTVSAVATAGNMRQAKMLGKTLLKACEKGEEADIQAIRVKQTQALLKKA